MRNSILVVLASLLFLSSCKKDDDPQQGNFTVTIENVSEAKAYTQTGKLDGIAPGGSQSFSFHAGIGAYLSYAQMLVQSNDLFFAPADSGIPLYTDRTPLTGDITNLVTVWDAGTEVNMEPGTGSDQAPRQAGPNTGAAENGVVIEWPNVNDGFSLPPLADLIKIDLAHDGGTMFTVTITNLSNASSLPTPMSPGAYVVHPADTRPIFTENDASTVGLERVAEDGNNEILADDLARETGYVSPFAPGAYAVYQGDNPIFQAGTLASSALEALAEDGNPSGYSNIFNTPVGAGAAGPIFTGDSYEFTFDAMDGDKLSFATMLIQTNDLFFAPEGIELFNNGNPVSGDYTAQTKLWDAYTEVNEYPGAGNNQAPRQAAANTGATESANVNLVSDAFSYPAENTMIKVTITAN